MKANNALPYVPIMQKCEVIEHGDRWLMRNIVVNNVPLRERVTFEPEQRVIFERVAGSDRGESKTSSARSHGNLTLTFSLR